MQKAQTGDTVTVQYVGTLDNGRIFDSTTDDAPRIFTIGAEQVFAALERAVIGMRVGETKNFVIPAAEAFGPRSPENVVTVARTSFPPGELTVGKKVRLEFRGGKERVFAVTAVTDAAVTLDGNHPLAGLDLTFALRLDGIARGPKPAHSHQD
jgi:FKBP-type peptidyl-prolyl cis-trans isomerase 2